MKAAESDGQLDPQSLAPQSVGVLIGSLSLIAGKLPCSLFGKNTVLGISCVLCIETTMIDGNDFLKLTGLEWGHAWESQWVDGVDDEFVSFVAGNHADLEDSRMRCALDLFRTYNSSVARDIAQEYVNDIRRPIRDAARNVFNEHHQRGWIDCIPQSEWQSNASLEPPQLSKRQRQRQRKYGDPFARGEERS